VAVADAVIARARGHGSDARWDGQRPTGAGYWAAPPDNPPDRSQPVAQWMLPAGLVVTLAGIWMTMTHVPLVAQASRGEAPWAGTLFHMTPP